MLFIKKMENIIRRKTSAFTLVELLIASSVLAIGMVFVLGALGRCIGVLDTSEKMIQASYLLNGKMWEIDRQLYEYNGSIEGEWEQTFEAPYSLFSWKQAVVPLEEDSMDDEALFLAKVFNNETVEVSWKQGKVTKDISVARYVKKQKPLL